MNTKNNKKNLGLVARAQNSLVGKTLRRLMGEETGVVTMEYVVIALLVVAASAVAIWYFGRTVQDAGANASEVLAGKVTKAQEDTKKLGEEIDAAREVSKDDASEFIDANNEDAITAK